MLREASQSRPCQPGAASSVPGMRPFKDGVLGPDDNLFCKPLLPGNNSKGFFSHLKALDNQHNLEIFLDWNDSLNNQHSCYLWELKFILKRCIILLMHSVWVLRKIHIMFTFWRFLVFLSCFLLRATLRLSVFSGNHINGIHTSSKYNITLFTTQIGATSRDNNIIWNNENHN